MEYNLPSQIKAELSNLKSKRIISVKRSFLISDFEDRELDVRNQDSDGPLELKFDSGEILHIIPDTERFGIDISFTELPEMGEYYTKAVFLNKTNFWKNYINTPIKSICILQFINELNECPHEFAIQFIFEANLGFQVEYVVDDMDYFDQLRIQPVIIKQEPDIISISL
ncbi:hypothetical protein MJH12_02585 [bacterium]|nr:hypothetical protein [bacterium]